MDHPIPDASLGKNGLELNLLAGRIREVSLPAANAFEDEVNVYGIIKALNRLRAESMLCLPPAFGYYDRMEE